MKFNPKREAKRMRRERRKAADARQWLQAPAGREWAALWVPTVDSLVAESNAKRAARRASIR